MMDLLPKVVKWVGEQWKRSPVWLRVLYVFGLLLLVGSGVAFLPWVKDWRELYDKLPSLFQGMVLLGVLVGGFGAALYAYNRASRVEDLKGQNEQLKADLAKAQTEIASNDSRMAHLLDVESRARLWQRPPTVPPPEFIPLTQRKTRFLTVLNLKGGVGKTTLTANIAAGLGSEPNPLRVLLVDVDFQGTLGVACVDPQFQAFQDTNDHFVHRLLQAAQPDDGLLPKLRTGMKGVPTAQVVLASDELEQEEFQLQARYFLDPVNDPRFRLRTHLHRAGVTNEYDLVVFDCPPRVTASVVNALFCSDFVLIPTRLDAGSVDAVPRTVEWVKKFGPLCPAAVVGVVVTHVGVVGKKLIKRDENAYEDLRRILKLPLGSDAVFKAVIRTTPDAVNAADGVAAGTTPRGRAVYAEFVKELRKRMSL